MHELRLQVLGQSASPDPNAEDLATFSTGKLATASQPDCTRPRIDGRGCLYRVLCMVILGLEVDPGWVADMSWAYLVICSCL